MCSSDQCTPNYLEHDVPGISPMPSHNITIKTQINYLGSANQLFKSPKYPLKISQVKPQSNWSNRGRNGVKTPKIASVGALASLVRARFVPRALHARLAQRPENAETAGLRPKTPKMALNPTKIPKNSAKLQN